MNNYRTTLWSTLVNRTVGWVFGILLLFVLIAQAIMLLELDPFANLVVRILVVPGYVVILSYTILGFALAPDAGRVVRLLGGVLYLYLLSVLIAETYRTLR